MSNASHNRGSAVISRQIRQRNNPSAPPTMLQLEQEIARLIEERDRAYAIAREQAEQVQGWQDEIAYQIQQREIVNGKLSEAQQEIARWQQENAKTAKAMFRARKAHVKASAMLRCLSPEECADLREQAQRDFNWLDWSEEIEE